MHALFCVLASRLVRIFLLSLALFLIGALLRVQQISSQDVQGDELMWLKRSSLVLAALEQGQWSRWSSHLGHPGIPPALAMAAGQYVTRFLPQGIGFDPLAASRLGNALASALIGPVVFLCVYFLFKTSREGWYLAFLSALCMSLDPQHIAISRLAHVDAVFSILVSLCCTFFFYAETTGSLAAKIIAGFFWGLCLTCKPTAWALPPAFFLFRLYLQWCRHGRALLVRGRLCTWSDVSTLLVGLSVLALLFTRFWQHNGPFLSTLNVQSMGADTVYALGTSLAPFIPVLSLLAFGGLVLLRKNLAVDSFAIRNFSSLLCCLSITVLALSLVPAVFENFVRYFLRLPGLAEFVRVPSGYAWGAPSWGYLGVLYGELPTWLIFGLAFGLLGICVDCRRGRFSSEYRDYFVFSLFVVLAWLSVLSVATKYFVRYLLPILPFLYAFASYGMLRLSEVVGVRVLAERNSIARYGASAMLLALLLTVSVIVHTHPRYLNFYNTLSGGLAHASRANYPLFSQGAQEALQFLRNLREKGHQMSSVALVGEEAPLMATDLRVAGAAATPLPLGIHAMLQSADAAIISYPLLGLFKELYGVQLTALERNFICEVDGVPMAAVYVPVFSDFREGASFPLLGFSRETGGVTTEDGQLPYKGDPALYALPGRHSPGRLFFGERLRVQQGTYTVGMRAARPLESRDKPDIPHEVVRLEFGDECELAVSTSELTTTEFQLFSTECNFATQGSYEIQGSWTGIAPLVVRSFDIRRVDESKQ